MRPLVEKETRKLCKKLSNEIKHHCDDVINFDFMASNIHLMGDGALLTFYKTLVSYDADKNFKAYLLGQNNG